MLPFLLLTSGLLPGRPSMHPASSSTTRRRAPVAQTLEFVDADGDVISFSRQAVGLEMVVGEEVMFEAVETLNYTAASGRVMVDGDLGDFTFRPEDRQKAAALGLLASQTDVEWVGDPPVALPAEVEALLADSDELQASRPAVRVLWAELTRVYPDEAAAIRAVQRNSAIVLPYLNRPSNIAGSWAVVSELMSEEEALQVITDNPGVLSANPIALRKSSADDIRRAASLVVGVDALPLPVRFALSAGAVLAVVALVAKGVLDK